MSDFIARERAAQAAFFARQPAAADFLHPAAPYRLRSRKPNFAPDIASDAEAYFADKVWHIHASHGLSSQVCCLNFLMPLARRPELLKRLVSGVLGFTPAEMLPVERGPDGGDWFVGFEWPGRANYLAEWPSSATPSRGANVSCADAVVRFRGPDGDETLLIEWKYSEAYNGPIQNKSRPGAERTPNQIRTARYASLAFAPAGPVRSDLGLTLDDFFYEPLYQLLRQQMLAKAMEEAGEDGARRVRVLHISPSGNQALHRVNSPAFKRLGHTDAIAAFEAMLVAAEAGQPRFLARTTEQVFGPLLTEIPDDPWARYLTDRYTFLQPADAAEPV